MSAGAVSVKEISSVPVADDFSVAETVKVALPPASRLTEAEMSPAPEAGQDEPSDAAQVQVTPHSFDENESATAAPVTSEGPLFVTTIVYVTATPALIDVLPSDFVIARSELKVIVSESVAELLPGTGSFKDTATAEISALSRHDALPIFSVAETVKVALPPASRLTEAEMSPAP